MELMMSRMPLPDRRLSWTQRAAIGGQTVYLTVGEYPGGRPGEIFVDVSKQGTFLRGVMGALARMASMALQCGAGVDLIVHSLRGLDFPPNGPVEGSSFVWEASSVADWISQELEHKYMRTPVRVPEKVAGAYEGSGV
jgi:ribonucleoside-diphosphate reductase alpha chain